MSTQLNRPTFVKVPTQVVSFKPQRMSFTIHNANREPKSPMFCGNIITVPAVFDLQYTLDDKSRRVLISDTDTEGHPMPGTRVVEDNYVYVEQLEEEVCIFDATRAVKHILGLVPGSDGMAAEATSPWALAGLSLLPRHAEPSLWKEVARSGDQRVFLNDVEKARRFMKQLDDSNALRKAAGRPETMDFNPLEYQRYKAILEQYEKLARAETMVNISPLDVEDTADELALEAFLEAEALKLAKETAERSGVSEVELARRLLQNPKVRIALQKDFRIRKRGERQKSKAELMREAEEEIQRKVAAQAGTGASVQSGPDEDDDEDEGDGEDGANQ